MTPENNAWRLLTDRAAAQLPGNFAERVLREVRLRSEATSSLYRQAMLSAATAALCFLAVAFFHTQFVQNADTHSLTDWQKVASALDDSSLAE